MKRRAAVLLAVVVGSILLVQLPAWSAGKGKVLEFATMAPVDGPFVGSANPIRGINAAGLPWVIRHGEARLDSDGELRVTIRGLVLDPDDPTVISRGLAGNNVSAQFRAVLSCLSVDTGGNAITVNLATQPVDAPTGVGGGDADIREKLSPPTPCIAPIVFITSPGGSWFAASGF